MRNNKLIVMLIMVLLMAGCTNEKCVESHQKQGTCVMYHSNGKMILPMYYSCTKTICDKYEEDN